MITDAYSRSLMEINSLVENSLDLIVKYLLGFRLDLFRPVDIPPEIEVEEEPTGCI